MTLCLAALVACSVFPGCSEDEAAGPAVVVQDKDEVLADLAQAWNDRDNDAYAALVDDDFVGHFGPPEQTQGCTSQNWNRARELGAAHNIFDSLQVGGLEIVQSISLKLTYPDGGWSEYQPPGPATPAQEKWYIKTVTYRISAAMQTTFLVTTPGSVADIVIRPRTAADGSTVWKIVAFSDRVEGGGTVVQGAAWSRFKCLYRPRP